METKRLGYLDNIRIFVTVLVVAHHAGQAYGPTGGDWPVFEEVRAQWLGPFFTTNAAWFMGLFFLLSGYFTPASFDRKGAVGFLKDRFMRLGLPLVLFWSPTIGLFQYMDADTNLSLPAWMLKVYILGGNIEVAHLWFVVHLLVYSLIYVAWRSFGAARDDKPAPPANRHLILYIVLLAAFTYLARIEFPVDHWIWIGGVIPSEVAHLPQYVSLFFIGILAGCGRWFESVDTSRGLAWAGLSGGVIGFYYLYALLLRQWFSLGFETGGHGIGSFFYALFEAVICTGMCFGLPIVFRWKLNPKHRWFKHLADNAYTVYIIHFLVLVMVQKVLLGLSLSPSLKFVIATITATVLCFSLAHMIRLIPGIRRVL